STFADASQPLVRSLSMAPDSADRSGSAWSLASSERLFVASVRKICASWPRLLPHLCTLVYASMTLVRSVPLCPSSPDRAFAACNCSTSAVPCVDDCVVDVAPAAGPGDEPGPLLEESRTAVTAMTTM